MKWNTQERKKTRKKFRQVITNKNYTLEIFTSLFFSLHILFFSFLHFVCIKFEFHFFYQASVYFTYFLESM